MTRHIKHRSLQPIGGDDSKLTSAARALDQSCFSIENIPPVKSYCRFKSANPNLFFAFRFLRRRVPEPDERRGRYTPIFRRDVPSLVRNGPALRCVDLGSSVFSPPMGVGILLLARTVRVVAIAGFNVGLPRPRTAVYFPDRRGSGVGVRRQYRCPSGCPTRSRRRAVSRSSAAGYREHAFLPAGGVVGDSLASIRSPASNDG